MYVLLITIIFLVSPIFATEISEQIVIDQFGWRTNAKRKTVIFSNPVRGQNASCNYIPGEEFEIKSVIDNLTVYKSIIRIWNNGQIDSVSGDQVWWGDFSNLYIQGEYYIYDPRIQ